MRHEEWGWSSCGRDHRTIESRELAGLFWGDHRSTRRADPALCCGWSAVSWRGHGAFSRVMPFCPCPCVSFGHRTRSLGGHCRLHCIGLGGALVILW